MDAITDGPVGVEQVVRRYLDAFEGRDPDRIASLVTDDFVNEHTAALGEGCVGRDAYRQRLPAFLDEMRDLRYAVEDVIVDGARAAVTYTLHARWQGERPIVVRGAQRIVVRDGLVAARTDYWDAAGFLLQAAPGAADALGAFGVGANPA